MEKNIERLDVKGNNQERSYNKAFDTYNAVPLQTIPMKRYACKLKYFSKFCVTLNFTTPTRHTKIHPEQTWKMSPSTPSEMV